MFLSYTTEYFSWDDYREIRHYRKNLFRKSLSVMPDNVPCVYLYYKGDLIETHCYLNNIRHSDLGYASTYFKEGSIWKREKVLYGDVVFRSLIYDKFIINEDLKMNSSKVIYK